MIFKKLANNKPALIFIYIALCILFAIYASIFAANTLIYLIMSIVFMYLLFCALISFFNNPKFLLSISLSVINFFVVNIISVIISGHDFSILIRSLIAA